MMLKRYGILLVLLNGCSTLSSPPEPHVYLQQADALPKTVDAALPLLQQQHLWLTKQHPQNPDQATTALIRGLLALLMNDPQTELHWANTVLASADTAPWQQNMAWQAKARAHFFLAQIEPMWAAWGQVTPSPNETLNLWFWADAGMINFLNGDLERANFALDKAFAQFEQAPDNLVGQAILSALGIGLNALERYDQAVVVERSKIERDMRSANLRGLSDSYYNLAGLYRKMGQPELALLQFTQALDYSRQIPSKTDEAFVLQQLAEVSYDLQEYPQALAFNQLALQLADAEGIDALAVPVRITMAKLFSPTSPALARAWLQEAKALALQQQSVAYLHTIEGLLEALQPVA